MLKPLWKMTLDQEMTLFLVEEMNRLLEDAKAGRYSNEMLTKITHFNNQMEIQLQEQNVDLTSADELKTYGYCTVEKNQPIPPVRTTFFNGGKPLGTIIQYNPETGRVVFEVLDKELHESIKNGGSCEVEYIPE